MKLRKVLTSKSVKDFSSLFFSNLLQKIFGLPDEGLPLLAVVSRLAEQKGIGQLVEVLAEMLPDKSFQFVLLGSGDEALKEMLHQLQAAFPQHVGVEIGYDQPLSHKIEAGADFFLG